MTTTRVFKSGNSQAVRLPKEFQLSSKEVEIFKRNNDIIIREKPENLAQAYELLTKLGKELFPDRKDEPPQHRDFF